MEPKRTTGEPASGGPNLRMADAIFFLGHRDVPIDDQQKADLLAFVRDDGKGFVAAHTATDGLRLVAGVRRAARAAATTAIRGTSPTARSSTRRRTSRRRGTFRRASVTDEFYQPKEFSRDKARVLLRLDVARMPAAAPRCT